jgi:hypothetical protein
MTMGNAATARVRLIVWCKTCSSRSSPDPAKLAARCGAETSGSFARNAAGRD